MKKMSVVLFFIVVFSKLCAMDGQVEFCEGSVKEIASAIKRRCKGSQAEIVQGRLWLSDKSEKKHIKNWLELVDKWDDEFTPFEDVQDVLDTDKEQSAVLRLSSSSSSVSQIFKIIFCSSVKRQVLEGLLTRPLLKL